MHLADLNVNVNQSSLTSIKLLSPQITDSTFAAIGVRSFTKACMTRLGALVRGGVEGVVGTLAMDLLWYPSGLLIRTRPLPQTGIGGKNDHVVDQLGLTYCRKDGLVGVLPAPATLPCSEAS
jgi:hypothetical protein